LNTIRTGDYYLLSDDFDSYIQAVAMVDEAYQDKEEWVKKSIRTTAKVGSLTFHLNIHPPRAFLSCWLCVLYLVDADGHDLLQMGKFSSDRAIVEYAESYWNIEATSVEKRS
jgi:glycogen phosphorylase